MNFSNFEASVGLQNLLDHSIKCMHEDPDIIQEINELSDMSEGGPAR